MIYLGPELPITAIGASLHASAPSTPDPRGRKARLRARPDITLRTTKKHHQHLHKSLENRRSKHCGIKSLTTQLHDLEPLDGRFILPVRREQIPGRCVHGGFGQDAAHLEEHDDEVGEGVALAGVVRGRGFEGPLSRPPKSAKLLIGFPVSTRIWPEEWNIECRTHTPRKLNRVPRPK